MRDSLASLLPSLPEDIQRAAVMDSLCRLHNEGDTARLQAVFAHIGGWIPFLR